MCKVYRIELRKQLGENLVISITVAYPMLLLNQESCDAWWIYINYSTVATPE